MRAPHGLRRARLSCAAGLVALLAVLAGPAAIAFADSDSYKLSVLGDTPTGFYPLDGATPTVALDASGNAGNNLSGPGAGVTTGYAGPFTGSKAYRFTGLTSDGYLGRSHYTATDNFAIELWARSEAPASEYATPVSNGSVDGTCPYGAWPVVKANAMYAYAAGGCGHTAGTATYPVFSGTTDWHHVVMTRTAGLSTLWVDGVQKSSTNTMAVSYTVNGQFRIGNVLAGSAGGTTGGPFKGYLSNVAFYGHALTGADIGDHFTAAQDLPVTTTAPVLAPTTSIGPGTTVRTTTGTWTGVNITYGYQWQRCDGAGGACADIPGATSSAYTLTDDDTEGTVRARVGATNAGGTASVVTEPTDFIAVQTPRGQAAYVNAVLNDTPTGYYLLDGASPTSAQDSSGNPGNSLSGPGVGITTGQPGPFPGSQSYRFDTDTMNGYLDRSYYTATDNFAIELWARSNLSPNKGTPVSNGSVSGTCPYGAWPVAVGSSMYAYATGGCGSTAGTGWYSVFSSTTDWHHIVLTRTAGLTSLWVDGVQQSSTNTMTVAHSSGDRFRIGNVAGGTTAMTAGGPFKGYLSNVAFYSHALSGASIAAHRDAAQGGPTDRVRPRISPSTGLIDGDLVTVDAGGWEGVPIPDHVPGFEHTFQWERCDGATCTPIPGETGTSYTLSNADIGKAMRVTVTATGPTGTGTVVTRKTAVVAPRPPVNTAPPAVSGTPTDFQTLSSTAGDWTGSTPIAYTRQWQRCNAVGGACVGIAGATGSTYTLTSAEVGKTVRVVVTATNAAAAVSAPSAVTAPIAGVAPANAVAPAISGTAKDTQTLSASTGTWTGSTPRTYTRRWQRCDAAGGACADIAGATGTTYVLTTADVGSRIRVVVTATNMVGAVPAISAATATVVPAPPASTAVPAIGGTARDGEALTATTGTWKGTTPITYTYQWRLCDAGGTGCADLDGATAGTYTPTAADVGHALRVVVTATNVAGAASATSAASAVVAAVPPSDTTAPSIAGEASDDETLTASAGDWAGSAPITYTYAWQRCDADGEGCAAIDGATSETYTLTSDDVGATVRVVVSAHNAGGDADAASAVTAPVAAIPPTADEAPSISGDAIEGQTLTGSVGAWSGTTPIAYQRQWQRCDADGDDCVDIDDAGGITYTVTAQDAGARLRLRITATNAADAVVARSAPTEAVAAA